MGTLERWVLWLCVISTLLVLAINAYKPSNTPVPVSEQEKWQHFKPPVKDGVPMFQFYDMEKKRKVQC